MAAKRSHRVAGRGVHQGRQRRAQKVGVALLLCGGTSMFTASMLSFGLAPSAWWWLILALVGLLYVVVGVRQLRRYRACAPEQELAADSSPSRGRWT